MFQSQKLRGFDVYISGLSMASLAIAPELDKMDTPHIFLAFDAMLTNGAPNRFRILPSYKNEGPKYAEYAKYRKAKRIFMLTLNVSPTEDEFTRYVEPELAKMGVEHVRERFEMSTADYRSLVLKAVAYKPDLIIINGLSFHILPLVQNLNALGFIPYFAPLPRSHGGIFWPRLMMEPWNECCHSPERSP